MDIIEFIQARALELGNDAHKHDDALCSYMLADAETILRLIDRIITNEYNIDAERGDCCSRIEIKLDLCDYTNVNEIPALCDIAYRFKDHEDYDQKWTEIRDQDTWDNADYLDFPHCGMHYAHAHTGDSVVCVRCNEEIQPGENLEEYEERTAAMLLEHIVNSAKTMRDHIGMPDGEIRTALPRWAMVVLENYTVPGIEMPALDYLRGNRIWMDDATINQDGREEKE